MAFWSRRDGAKRRRFGCLPIFLAALALMILLLAIAAWPRAKPQSETLAAAADAPRPVPLRTVQSFAGIADTDQRSVALFTEAGRVIQHPRCLNCHPRTDSPTQTDAMRPHSPAMARGIDGLGLPTLRCSTCHHDANFDASGVPGNPKWRLAPIEMAWQGKSLGEICKQLLDPGRAHMSREELLHHMAHDDLVGWAWHPGGDRTPAPGTQQQFGALIEAWLKTGARCPS